MPVNTITLLQHLIQFNTTNPPGNELACITYLNKVLQEAGIETLILAKDDQRPNLIARLEGIGNAPPLLLQGHVDVVTTVNQVWQQDPFLGEIVAGSIWGRGALDMKGGVAMMVSAFIRAKINHLPLPGDVILAIVSDEEAGGDFGSRFLVESHPALFKGVQVALGEFGGFSTEIANQRFYPIMVAEKQICRVELTLKGRAGHGSMPIQGGAMAKLGRILQIVDKKMLPVHITAPARMMINGLTAALPQPQRLLLNQLLNPLLTSSMLSLLGEQGRVFSPLLRHTVSPTIVQGGEKINVIPAEIRLELDGRLLPGYLPDDLISELRSLLGKDVEICISHFDPGPAAPNMQHFDTLAGILTDADPEGTPIPMLLPGVTDARFFSKVGIQTYGFLPMKLPANFDFTQTIHGADERIPVDALLFGTEAIYNALQQIGAA